MKKAPTACNEPGAFGEQLSFLPPLPFYPTWPTKGTLADSALAMFMNGRMIDHPEFEDATKSWRLAAVVFQLRELGWPIESVEISSPTPEAPGRTIAMYYLPTRIVAKVPAQNGGASHA